MGISWLLSFSGSLPSRLEMDPLEAHNARWYRPTLCYFLLQIMVKLLPDFWCAERSFLKRTIPFNHSRWVRKLLINLVYWMHILVSFSCTNSSVGVQNQSFSQFVSLISVIFSNRQLQPVGNYIHKTVIKFVFCVVSLLWTSRYVLIDYTRLMHFLCCNLFVMLCWISSAISTNVLKIRLSITGILTFIDGQLHHKYHCDLLLSQFSRMFSKLAWANLRYWFLWGLLPILPVFMGYPPHGSRWLVLANFAKLLKTHVAVRRTWPFCLKC